MSLLAALAEHYHWPHDFWRRMGWRELRLWLGELRATRERQISGARTAPGSWAGAHADPFWQQARSRA